MIETLKIRLKESQRPIGVKRSTRLEVPPEDHVYGFQVKKDPEGVESSKYQFLIIF
jgi:hypothetical protein